jgi:hypothetical protein
MAQASGDKAYLAAARKPDKFVHGFGIFQRDLQFFKSNPDYFLEQRWADFDIGLAEFTRELKDALNDLGYAGRSSLSDIELCYVAIVYNIGFGKFRQSKGLEQGHRDDDVYYGQNIWKFLKLSHSISVVATVDPSTAEPEVANDIVARLAIEEGVSAPMDPLRGRICCDRRARDGGTR